MKSFYSNATMNELANEVVRYMPTMSDYYNSHELLSEYSKRINDYRPDSVHLARQSYFKQKLREKIDRIFSSEERQKIDLRINGDWGVVGGIVEHHGLLDHPLLLSVSLASNFYKLLQRKECGDVLVFATGNVPLSEPFRKRGFTLNDRKHNIYPKSYKNKVVYGLDKYEFDLQRRIVEAHEWHLLTKEEQSFLIKINSIIKNIDFSSCQTIGDQMTKINFYLWPYLFAENMRGRSANLISIEYDDIIIDYLIHIITHEPESHVYKMLFDKEFRDLILHEFEGSQGAWDRERGIGTDFFWALDDENGRIRLELAGDILSGKNFSVQLTPEEIISGLQSKRLLPGMLLKFSLIIFYMGMKPLMGYSLEYMTRLKIKMVKILEERFPEEAARSKKIPFDNMNLISLCKGENGQGGLKDLYAFDILFTGGFTEDYLKDLDQVPFKDFMAPSLLFAYNYALSKYGRQGDRKVFNITEDELQKPFARLFS